jgi:hypothetical protein
VWRQLQNRLHRRVPSEDPALTLAVEDLRFPDLADKREPPPGDFLEADFWIGNNFSLALIHPEPTVNGTRMSSDSDFLGSLVALITIAASIQIAPGASLLLWK